MRRWSDREPVGVVERIRVDLQAFLLGRSAVERGSAAALWAGCGEGVGGQGGRESKLVTHPGIIARLGLVLGLQLPEGPILLLKPRPMCHLGIAQKQANMCECAVKLLSAAGWHVHAVSVGHDARWACPASIAASSRAACCWFRLPARKTTAREYRRCWALLLNFKSEKRASLARRGSASAPPWLNADVAKLPQGVRSGAWLIGSGWVLRSSRVSAASRKSCTAKRSVSAFGHHR